MHKSIVAGVALTGVFCASAATLNEALERKLGPNAQDISSYVTVFNELEKLDAAADRAWIKLDDRAAYDRYRKALHAKMIAAMGGLPERTPLKPQIFKTHNNHLNIIMHYL
jgi:hypothetical protein